MNEPSPEFQLQQIHAVQVREAKCRLELMVHIAEYARMSAEAPDDEEALREQLGMVEDWIMAVAEAAREAGSMVGQAT